MKWQVKLFDPTNTIHVYGVVAESRDEAVVIAMDTAFEEMPDNQFALAGVEESAKLRKRE